MILYLLPTVTNLSVSVWMREGIKGCRRNQKWCLSSSFLFAFFSALLLALDRQCNDQQQSAKLGPWFCWCCLDGGKQHLVYTFYNIIFPMISHTINFRFNGKQMAIDMTVASALAMARVSRGNVQLRNWVTPMWHQMILWWQAARTVPMRKSWMAGPCNPFD